MSVISPSDLEASHTPATIRQRLSGSSRSDTYISDFIYGAIDGTVTTFAVVAGVAGAGLSEGIMLLLGIASLVADGFSMAASNFLGTRANDQARDKVRRQEEEHVAIYPEGEREEIRQIFHKKGFRGSDLERIVEVITEDKQRWIETMLREEHGYSAFQPSPWKAAMVTFFAFIVVGSVPLISFVANWIVPGLITDPFKWSCVFTAVAFGTIGAMKSRFSLQHWAISAMETLAIGGVAALIAYFLGESLKGLV